MQLLPPAKELCEGIHIEACLHFQATLHRTDEGLTAETRLQRVNFEANTVQTACEVSATQQLSQHRSIADAVLADALPFTLRTPCC